MKMAIDVSDRKEGELIREGLNDPEIRALVKIVGAMAGLSKRQKARALAYVKDHFDEMEADRGEEGNQNGKP